MLSYLAITMSMVTAAHFFFFKQEKKKNKQENKEPVTPKQNFSTVC